jgi:hypothetical protein
MIFDILYLVIIALIGLYIPNLLLDKKQDKSRKQLQNLFLFHMLVGVGYYFFTRNGGGDAWGYWKIAQRMDYDKFLFSLFEAKGTYFLYALNYFPAHILEMSFFSNTLLFSLIGFIGFSYFYIIALQVIPVNSKFKGYKLFPLIFFMPNLHFWSSGVGKDSILFLCIGMFVYSMLSITKRIPLFVISLLLSYLIRPHITMFLFVSFAFAFLFEAKVSPFKRGFLILILVAGSIALLPKVLEFSKIEEASVDSFTQFSANKAQALSGSHSGSSIDISSYPFPLKVFSFLYRPFFFDIRSAPAVIASFENLILLMLTFQIFRYKPLDTFRKSPFVIKGLVFFLLIGTLAFSQTLGNLGIMIRMRNMFLPGMLIYVLWAFSTKQMANLRKKRWAKTKVSQSENFNLPLDRSMPINLANGPTHP